MRHFGNSLTYEEIIEDIKMNEKKDLIGVQNVIVRKGEYRNGKFILSTIKNITQYYYIYDKGDHVILKHNEDSGRFDNVQQAKNRARYLYGKGIKWKYK